MKTENAPALAQIGRELTLARQALHEPGAGAPGSLECRVAGLHDRFLSTPARSLADVAARLEVIRSVVEGLGPRGELLDLVEAGIADVRGLMSSG
jgi:hypothetical protein